ncbi:hypothetical protein [Azospirillum canadense]|uniref:hypothetical protein n=1 Tax=Azospirillum canadense TaxID=403962 RepID=UPI0022265705|nr:hypothetical protein [Azospirillum canadense]MCW2239739.1 hypothetical protein [Azospirillum canadense]
MIEDEARVKLGNVVLHANLLAMGVLLDKMMEELFRRSEDPRKKADEWLRLFEVTADQMTFPTESPEWSDLASQEFRDILMKHIHRARSMAIGEPIDDHAYLRRGA